VFELFETLTIIHAAHDSFMKHTTRKQTPRLRSTMDDEYEYDLSAMVGGIDLCSSRSRWLSIWL
jgi:hypothetical protein